ncbi:cytochrome b5 [Lactifluus volemus]|nr:cytochrome b5 [Lactifluus volemus]
MSFSLSLSHPINTALLLYILYLLQRIILPSTPRSHAPALLFTTFTPRTLTKFNGLDGGRILLAIAGTVFDVTAGRGFYGPDGMYGNFAGRDASRGMAKQSFDLEMLTPVDQPLDKLEDLTPEEMSVREHEGLDRPFFEQYIVCGRLVENE